ncbi:MAG TPA: N-terminal phage integrase SAM-like domain-containing protein, partial [Acidimicrobiia bacterium]
MVFGTHPQTLCGPFANPGEIFAGRYVDSTLGKIRFDEWLPQAEAARINRRPSTKARDEPYYRNLVVPTFGTMPLGSIQPVHVQRW